jgi:transketolase
LNLATILKYLRKTIFVVTCEEHKTNGSLGDGPAQCFAQNFLDLHEYIAVNNSFCESGTPAQLMKK